MASKKSNHRTQQSTSLAITVQSAVQLHLAGQLDAAVAAYQTLLQQQPHEPIVTANLASIWIQQQQCHQAFSMLEAAIAIHANNEALLRNMLITLHYLGDSTRLVFYGASFLALNSTEYDVLAYYVNALIDTAQYSVAIQVITHVAQHNQTPLPKLWVESLAFCYFKNNAFVDCIQCVNQYQSQHTPWAGLWFVQANAYREMGHMRAAIAQYQQVLQQEPTHTGALTNLAYCYIKTCQWKDAQRVLQQQLQVLPDDASAQFNLATVELHLGNLVQGFRLYEARHVLENYSVPVVPTTSVYLQPNHHWANRTVLLYAEQGFGDSLQMLRFLPLFIQHAQTLILVVHGALHTLVKHAFHLASVTHVQLYTPTDYAEKSIEKQPVDYHASLMSLPYIVQLSLEQLPYATHYLTPPPDAVNRWRNHIQALQTQRKQSNGSAAHIGLVWSGSATHHSDHRRSIALKLLGPLLQQTGVVWHSLQKEYRVDDQDWLAFFNLYDHAQTLQDYADTAGLIATLDCVITVDTSVAHLAAAMGKPVWLLVAAACDWRWLTDRTDSPWYPSVTLYRQQLDESWGGVITRVADDLKQWLAERIQTSMDSSGILPVSDSKKSEVKPKRRIALSAGIQSKITVTPSAQAVSVEQDANVDKNAEETLKAMFERAVAAQYQRQFVQAQQAYVHFLQALSVLDEQAQAQFVAQRTKAHANVGSILLAHGDLHQGLQHLQSSLAFNALQPAVLRNMVSAYQALHQTDLLIQTVYALWKMDEAAKKDRHVQLALGTAYSELNQPEKAAYAYHEALKCLPEDVDLLNNFGYVLYQLKDYLVARESLASAVRLNPQHGDAWFNYANVLKELGEYTEAKHAYEHALALKPEQVNVKNNAANNLLKLKQPDAALALFSTLMQNEPPIYVRRNYANALMMKGRYDEAEHVLQGVLEEAPLDMDALGNLGVLRLLAARYHDAVALYQRILTIDPQNHLARFNLGVLQLLQGDFAEGWKNYEARRENPDFSKLNAYSTPLWQGEAGAGKRLLLHAEQGLGDMIQMLRFVPRIQAMGFDVVLSVQPAIVDLIVCQPQAYHVVSREEPLPEHQVQCPIMSLPYVLGITLDQLNGSPYLDAPVDKVQAMQQWMQHLPHVNVEPAFPKVGVVWSGSTIHQNDETRSIALSVFSQLFQAHPRTLFVVLQKEFRAGDLDQLAAINHQRSVPIYTCADKLQGFSDTMGLIAQLDVVITIDTSVAHVAAAMGKPVWLLVTHVPDFRWLLDRDDSPWYNSIRLFRQPSVGDWPTTLQQVSTALSALSSPK